MDKTVENVTENILPTLSYCQARVQVHLKSLIRDLDLELVAIIACLHPPPTHPPTKLF